MLYNISHIFHSIEKNEIAEVMNLQSTFLHRCMIHSIFEKQIIACSKKII